MHGLEAVPEETELVAVHDGARPLVSPEVITKVILKAAKFGAAAPAIPVKDTIKVSKSGGVDETPDRKTLFVVQTPQVFDAALLREAYRQPFSAAFTDDASVVEAAGHAVTLCEGERENIKITTPSDLDMAEAILNARDDEA